jgi:protein-S-isoprenylcysteine O-methyltransferase Ste14
VLLLWVAWLVYWRLSAADVKPTVRHESKWSRISYVIPLLIASILLFIRPIAGGGFLFSRFLPEGIGWYWLGVALVAAGLGFSVWARQHLGRNWSGTVEVKQDHQLICTGPYRFVRHPIYTGLLVAFLGTAIVIGQWRGILAVLFAFGSFWRKLTLEERFMRETFGSAYEEYRARTAALIAFRTIWLSPRWKLKRRNRRQRQ